MPLHMTKIAYDCASLAELQGWFGGPEPEKRLTTRYLPKRHAEMAGGSLYWIHSHALVGRSPIVRFEQKDDGRWWIVLENRLIPVHPRAKRAHQGWRYLAEADAPADVADGETTAPMPGKLVRELSKLGLA
ncbi:MAG: hypothetical protein B7Z08_00755 [Sphingomonadales bacterium 32-68-7]|nr:MAG: hypothetical protein B7Z33_12730 [Sphingomonadales bacterium 12-68-11]OYX10458.1 MAG: hypothetical protein B7Z08_00755 [Sphingomonadales bacterium 32-68-7]